MLLGGVSYHRFGTWLMVLGLYDLIFALLGYAVFDFLLEDYPSRGAATPQHVRQRTQTALDRDRGDVAGHLSLVFFYAPIEADQGFLQKIFYLHVPLAIISLCGFIVGGIFAILPPAPRRPALRRLLLRLDPHLGDLRRRRPVTGSIWAKGSWGHWWVWNEPTLVSFLIVFLLYATYYPFRYAIEDRQRQARYASVFAITAGAFVPLNFMAVRLRPRWSTRASSPPPKAACPPR